MRGAVALAAFAALAVYTALSMTWSLTPGESWLETNRTFAYLATMAAGLALGRLAPRQWGAMLIGVALGAVVICGWSLLTKIFPAALAPDEASRVELDAGSPAIVVGHREDAVRIARNLVANALAYGRERVRVTTATEAGNGTLTVDDDGPGIPVAERERVFDRFARLDRSRSREGGGFGLGLAISRELAVAQAGRIEVGDSPLGGARMALYLPSAGAGQ